MEFLLSENFNVESNEGKVLINRIQSAYNAENAEEFLKIGEEIADVVLGNGEAFHANTGNLNENMYKIVMALTDMQAMAVIQMLIKIRRGSLALNDILGDSDDIFRHLKEISQRIEKEEIEEGMKIKRGKAFYHIA